VLHKEYLETLNFSLLARLFPTYLVRTSTKKLNAIVLVRGYVRDAEGQENAFP
jgi:hypothetical protein